MPDMDDIREGSKFSVGKPSSTESFYLKGNSHQDWGIKERLSRIFNFKTGKTVMLAFDHGFIMGPTSGLERIDLQIVPLANKADCLMATRGVMRAAIPPTMNKPLCLRSDAGTTILTELNDNVVIDIKDAIRLDASAMAVMVAVGDDSFEASTVRNLFNTVDKGLNYGIPVMAVTSVGKNLTRDAKYMALATRVCAENGAHLVKTYYTDGFEKVTAACPVPIVIAGGKKLPEFEALELAYKAIDSGAAGVDMGRNIFQSTNPLAMMEAVRKVVHENVKPKEAFDFFKSF